jgi:hypothetical protein
MTRAKFDEQLAQHGRTHRIVAVGAANRGDYPAATRAECVAEWAERGRLLAHEPGDSNTPDLHAAAAEFGVLVDTAGQKVSHVQPPPENTVDHTRVGGQRLAPVAPPEH